MADTAVVEEIRKRRAADALLANDDEDPDPEPTEENVQSGDEDTGSTEDMGEKPSSAETEEVDQEEAPTAAAEKAPRLGYRFLPVTPRAQDVPQQTAEEPAVSPADQSIYDTVVGREEYYRFLKPKPTATAVPVSPPAEDVPQNVSQGTFLGEEGADVSPALTTQKIYSTPPEEGDQQYVIDQDTGQKIPRAQLATSEDLAAQPPPKGAVGLPRAVVSGQAPAPSTAFLGEEGVAVTPTAPAVKRAEPVTTEPVSVPTAEYTDRVQKWRSAMQAYGFDAKVKPDGTWVGVDSSGKEVTPEQNKGLYQFGARLSQQYGFSGQEEKLGQLGDAAPTAPAVKRALAIGAPPKVQPAQPITTNPNGSDFPQRVQAVGNNDPAAFIVHHTSGRGTVDGVVSTLKERGLGVQYVMDRQGNIFQTGGPGAQNILKGWGKGEGLSNQNIVGMEIIAKDDADVTPAQKAAFARFIAARYPTTPLFGHGEVNPGHKEADEGQSAKAAALAYRAQLSSGQVAQAPGAAPQAQPVTKQANGLYQNEKPQDFLSGPATTFATPEDIASGQDNGVGAPRLGRLDTTSVAGVAIPEAALRAKYGNNYAAWRRARIDVVDPQTGKRLRVPIVDLGPRGDQEAITDMTPTLSSYFGGDKNLMVKLVDNAGPDVTKNPQLFADEQAAIRQGFDSSAVQPGVQKIQPKLGYSFKPVVPSAEGAALQQADAFNQQNQRQTLADLEEQNRESPVGLFKRLDQPVAGVSDSMRQEFQTQVKNEITKYAQDFYNEPDPAKAFQKATSDANFGTIIGEAWRKIPAAYGQLDVALNQAAQSSDANALDRFARVIHPEATPEGRAAFIKTLTDIKDPAVRSRTIGKIWAELEPQKQASIDINGLVQSADNVADPAYQKAQQQAIDTKKAWINKQLRSDPRLEGTLGGFIADQGAQFLPNVTMALLPPGIRQSALAAQIYSQAKDEFKRDHPDWTEAQLNDAAGKSTTLQLGPQELLALAIGGKLGALTGGIESRAARIGATALSHIGIGAGAGAWQQIAANLAAGKPAFEGVPQAALAGVIQTLPGGIATGLTHPGPEARVAPETQGEVRPAEEAPVVRPAQEPVPPVTERPPVTKPEAVPAAPPEEPLGGAQIKVRKTSTGKSDAVLIARDETAFDPTKKGIGGSIQIPPYQVHGPFPIEGHTVNIPHQNDFLRGFNTDEEAYRAIEASAAKYGWKIESDPRYRYAEPWINKFQGKESAVPITQEDVARRTYELGEERAKSGQPGTAADDYAQAQKELSQATEPILPGTMSEAEPINSAIANRYVQERMATGELGQIDPSQGQSTEDMVQQGLQMSPTQRDGLIDNFTKGKGGDLDQQGAAIRSKEALLSEQARAASRAADADPTNPQLQAQAKAAADAVTAFHNGPIKKFKQVWSNAGRGLQREIPLDYTTFNGMKEAYLKGKNQEAPTDFEPRLKRMAEAVSKTTDAERVALNNFGKEIENQAKGKAVPADEQIRTRLMEIMKDLPCPS